MDKSNILSCKFTKNAKSQTTSINYFVPELNRNRTDEIEEQPHVDFLDALKALNPFLTKIFHAPDDADTYYEVTGFKYSNEKVILTGKVSTDDGGTIGIATPAVDTNGDSYGFEDEFSEAIATLVVETHELLTGKKTGVKQLTIDDSIKQNEENNNDILGEGTENEENVFDSKE